MKTIITKFDNCTVTTTKAERFDGILYYAQWAYDKNPNKRTLSLIKKLEKRNKAL